MGTGGILSKKSWHVGRKENRQRVIRDEQAAKEEALERQNEEATIARHVLYEQLVSKPSERCASTSKRPSDGDDGDAATRGKASTRTSDARFDASFRLGGSTGSGVARTPWYAATSTGDVEGARQGGESGRKNQSEERKSLLDAVKVVGKVKKMSKRDRRRAEKKRLLELRAARERREKLERERTMKAVLNK
jgi:hypothetical protein